MAKELAPAFQFYPKDFLSDSNTVGMTPEAIGVYVLLMMYCWLDQSLPDDPVKLARMARCKPTQFERNWAIVSGCFVKRDDGRFTHPRLDRIRANHESYRETKATAGKLGGIAKSALAKASTARVLPEQPPGRDVAKPASSISDLQSPICDLRSAEHTRARVSPIPSDETGLRAAQLLDSYAKAYEQRRSQPYRKREALEFQTALGLVERYSDTDLSSMVDLFLTTDHKFAASGSRTLRQFDGLAAWCFDELKAKRDEAAAVDRWVRGD